MIQKSKKNLEDGLKNFDTGVRERFERLSDMVRTNALFYEQPPTELSQIMDVLGWCITNGIAVNASTVTQSSNHLAVYPFQNPAFPHIQTSILPKNCGTGIKIFIHSSTGAALHPLRTVPPSVCLF